MPVTNLGEAMGKAKKTEEQKIEEYLDENYGTELGSGYILSKRLCVMQSRDGWGIYARVYTDANYGDVMVGPNNPDAEESDGFCIAALPTLAALKLFERFFKESNGDAINT